MGDRSTPLGAAAYAALVTAVREAKAVDPLRPVTLLDHRGASGPPPAAPWSAATGDIPWVGVSPFAISVVKRVVRSMKVPVVTVN